MKKITFIALLAIMLASCSKDVITGSGDTVIAERTVGNFTGINITGNQKIFISYAREASVKLKGYSNLIPHYITTVDDNVLYLQYENNTGVKNDNLEIYITMPYFTKLALFGSSAITATGSFQDVDDLTISSSGDGSIEIEQLSTNSYTLFSSGNNEVSTLGVQAKSAKIDLSGDGTASVSVTDKLEVHISGSGKVSYKGDPAELTSDISGNGSLIKL
ncbi:MAG TPA: DUF2807 domain-containing protein [Parafilimonas sp.]|nr:DUF2807 domain-containing protein [Parafilimonas sp.]